MDRTDLDAIQSKLKLAIKNHQMLVVKMKSEPQNAAMKTKLHQLQSEIMNLSDKQKTVVQNLRKELVQKQQKLSAPIHPVTTASVPVSAHTQSRILGTLPAHVQSSGTAAISVPAGGVTAVTALSLGGQPQLVACSTPIQAQAVILPTTFSVTVPPAHAKLRPTVVLPLSANASTKPSDLTVCLDPARQKQVNNVVVTSHNQTSTLQIKPALKPLAPRGSAPPIKVPQYHKTNSASSKSSQQVSKSLSVSSRNHMPPPQISAQQRETNSDAPKDSRRFSEKKPVKTEQKLKLDFMAALDLVTPDTLKELQCKRTERKRRSTANPQFSYNFEPERKRVSHYLLNPLPPGVKRPRGRPPKHGPSPNNSRPATPDSPANGSIFKNNVLHNGQSETHDDFCAVCGKESQLLPCGSCNMVYHLNCLNPPLTSLPSEPWSCPKCQASGKNWADSAETLALVHSYIATKAAKEEEKRKLQKKSNDLANEKVQLENKSKQLNNSFNEQVKKNQHLLETTSETQLTIEKLKNIIKVVQIS